MLCIVCLNEKAPGAEHVIPYAIGGSFTISRVCTECDNALGKRADAGLTKQFQMVERREELKLRGHRGTVPDPIAAALRKPVSLDNNPDHRVIVEKDAAPGEYRTRTAPRVEFEVEEHPGKLYRIELKKFFVDGQDSDKAEMLVRSGLRKAGLKDTAIHDKVWAQLAPTLELSEERDASVTVPIVQNLGGHQLGMVKIAYETAWHWLGESWLDDPTAHAMRAGLRKKPGAMREVLVRVQEPYETLSLPGYDVRKTHLVFIIGGRGNGVVSVRIMDVFSVLFLVTQQVARYAPPSKNAILMDAVNRTHREGSLAMLLQPGSDAKTEPEP